MTATICNQLRRGPVALEPHNFTPLQRTPWAGERIARDWKAHLANARVTPGMRIGESWEFSLGPEFPSYVAGEAIALADALQSEALQTAMLSGISPQEHFPPLIKLLDTAMPLSLQVHPRYDSPQLAPDECGKTESWLVLAAQPGAGIYLGFSRAVDPEALRDALQSDADVADLLHFEPVQVGDYFEIVPGVPHAIGAGLTLLEPQRVLPGKKGKTYRLYDWGRRYDSSGRLDDVNGQKRDLHLDAGLALIDSRRQVGSAFAQSLRRLPERLVSKSGSEVARFPSNGYYQLYHITIVPGSRISMQLATGYAALVMLKGDVHFMGDTKLRLAKGQSAVFPHTPSMQQVEADAVSAFALIVPHACHLRIDL